MLAVVGAPAQSPADAQVSHTQLQLSRDRRYRLAPSDVLDVRFRFSPEFNQEVTVQPDGFIGLQIAGEIKVQGMTISEAADAIVRECSGVLQDPVVIISLKDFVRPVFYVGGNVAKPGRFEFRGSMSVADALATAGGMIPGSRETEVILFRRVAGDMVETKRIDMKRAIEKDSLREDVMLQPNDLIYVPKSKIGKLERFMQVTRLGMYVSPIPF